MLADRQAAPFIAESPGTAMGATSQPKRRCTRHIRTRMRISPSVREGNGYGWADSLRWFTRELIIGSTRGWSRGIVLWNLALDEKHGPHAGGCGNCRGV